MFFSFFYICTYTLVDCNPFSRTQLKISLELEAHHDREPPVHEVHTGTTEIPKQQESTIVQAEIRSEETATDDVTMEAQPGTPDAPIGACDE